MISVKDVIYHGIEGDPNDRMNLEISRKNIGTFIPLLFDFTKKKIGITTDKDLNILLNKSEYFINRLRTTASGKNLKKEKRKNTIDSLKYIMKSQSVIMESIVAPYNFGTGNYKEQIDLKLEELGTKLACNLVDVSTEFEEKDKQHRKLINKDRLNKYRKKPNLKEPNRERVILITGAGVSHEATKKVMPLSKGAIDELRERIKTQRFEMEDGTEQIPGGIPKIVIDSIRKIVESGLKEGSGDFETDLIVYSRILPDLVKDCLRDFCQYTHMPNLEYEILAHLLKHRYIDVALNFNFDEIFDENLKEEIGNGAFKNIISAAQCPDNYSDLLVNNILKLPTYIKPYGTISHANSMRFSRDKLTRVPSEIKKTIMDIFEAKVKTDKTPKSLKINFIIIGFSMKSSLFLNSLKEYLKTNNGANPHFWIFDTKESLTEFELPLEKEYMEIIKKNCTYFQVTEEQTIAKYLIDLWGEIKTSFRNPKYQSIERHLFVNKLFDLDEDEIKKLTIKNPVALKQHYEDRILTELFIAYIASDGVINLKQIMEGRIGLYFQKLKKISNEFDVDLELKPISGYCKKLGLGLYKGYVPNAFVLDNPATFYDDDFVETLFDKLTAGMNSIDFSENRGKQSPKSRRKKLIEYAKSMKSSNRLFVNPNFDKPHSNLFTSIKDKNILNTSLSWQYRYRQMLEEDWDLMLAVSEKGRFLPINNLESFNKNKEGKPRKIELILSANNMGGFDNSNETAKRLNKYNLVSGKPLYLPWRLHNQHMVIFLKKNGKTKTKNLRERWKILNCIYYESRLLSRRINPVAITDTEDKNTLLNIFADYRFRATEYTQEKEKEREEESKGRVYIKRIPSVPNKQELDKRMEDLLSY